MILIDAHNIVSGGGLTLLNYLERALEKRNKTYCLIKNPVNVGSQSTIYVNCESPWKRRKVIRESIKKFNPETILCFGNYPPDERYHIKTITYLHNPYLVTKWQNVIMKDPFIPFRQIYLRRYLLNSDYYIFQNQIILGHFQKLYRKQSGLNYSVIPFFDQDKILKHIMDERSKKPQFIYVSLPHPHKNHNYLLNVWESLLNAGQTPLLMLTIPMTKQNNRLLRRIDLINQRGGKINNLGVLSYERILHHTAESKFCIFPSLFETLGLGLIEAALLKTKVVAAALPYTNEVVKASLYFDPTNVDSGKEVVMAALHNGNSLDETKPLIRNHIDEFLNIL